MAYSEKALLCSLLDQVVNAGRLDRLGEMVAPDVTAHLPDRSQPVEGVAALAEVITGLRTDSACTVSSGRSRLTSSPPPPTPGPARQCEPRHRHRSDHPGQRRARRPPPDGRTGRVRYRPAGGLAAGGQRPE